MSTVRAQIDGFVGFQGASVLLNFGDEWDAGHPIVAANPHLFSTPEPEPAPSPAKRPGRLAKTAAKDDDG